MEITQFRWGGGGVGAGVGVVAGVGAVGAVCVCVWGGGGGGGYQSSIRVHLSIEEIFDLAKTPVRFLEILLHVMGVTTKGAVATPVKYEQWYSITYPFLNFNGATVEV